MSRIAGTLASPDASGVTRFNALPAPELEALLVEACASRDWARAVAGGRPFADAAAVAAAGRAALESLSTDAWRSAVQALGDCPVPPADDGTRAAIAVALSLYSERFGWPFFTSHENLTGEQLLMRVRIRLGHDELPELRKSRAEYAVLVVRRLARLLAAS